MKRVFIAALIHCLCIITVDAQDTIPHLAGTIRISVKQGTIACDLTVSNMPRLSDYYFRLNSGMNIRYIRNAEGSTSLRYERSPHDTLSSGESSAYYLRGNTRSGKYLPASVRFNYVGMYPVITDTSSIVDWRGNIAFNGTTLRADGIQSAWTPILYDVKTDTRHEKVTYDLDITCEDCTVIYVNGSEPTTGTRAKIKSSKAQDLTMFAGDFRFTSVNGTYFLNPDADDQQLAELERTLQSYKNYFQKKLAIPYSGRSVYIQTTPVSKNNSWLFASYPTIVKIGWDAGMKTFASKTEGPGFLQYMAHELAHYYFGTYRDFNSELGDMISEGFAEYLAMEITRTSISDSIYRKDLRATARALGNFEAVPIASIRTRDDYGNRELYSYYYAPIIFSAIAKEIGEEKMWQWISSLLKTPTTFTNYRFFEQTLANVLQDKSRFEKLRDKYFISEKSLGNALEVLNLAEGSPAPAAGQKSEARTFYYFGFSRPYADAGLSQNQVLRHTAILQVTCRREELSATSGPLFKRLTEECENSSGCSSDFNTYDTREQAETALKRWLDRYNKSGKMLVKVLEM